MDIRYIHQPIEPMNVCYYETRWHCYMLFHSQIELTILMTNQSCLYDMSDNLLTNCHNPNGCLFSSNKHYSICKKASENSYSDTLASY